ncbi:cytochrome P450 [Paenibacillus cellulositrophicus]|uniref:cytochrome P450 family protein n=1 Tax=Paenibacillus cellulositrophicus TaxID=562959 RepID=UPI002041DE4B|nr:cytochrome P450 [Paenibacillus cellulositrophicus]MCM2996973.1 cytochrome P450 [Paenibacillus cellulositrophicus]
MREKLSGIVSGVDFLNHSFIQQPFPVYAKLRENEPVHRLLLPSGHYAWMVSRYEDAVKILQDGRFVTSPPHQGQMGEKQPPHMEIISNNLLSVGPEDHQRLRRLVQKAFTPRMIEKLRGRIEQVSEGLLDKVLASDKRDIDLIEEYAFPLPIIVICEMLGVPLEDQDKFRIWSNTIMEGVSNPQLSHKMDEVMKSFVEYLQQLIADRRKHLKEDLISDLISVEEQGDKLTEHELYALVFVLIIAGHETTVNLIGNGILAFLEHPEQKRLLMEKPDLIQSAVEEVLRFNGPAEVSNIRWAIEDVDFYDNMIQKGDMMLVALSSANRDSMQFDEPDTFDITRKVNNHIAFGKGVHYCLGAPLARLEGEIAINDLFRRLPDIRLNTDPLLLEWRPGMIIRGLKRLPIAF